VKRVAVLLVLVLVLGVAGVAAWALTRDDDDRKSGTAGDPVTPSASDSASATVAAEVRLAPDDDLQPFYDQEAEWQECDAYECARIEVPLDYDDPTGDVIELQLLKNPADEPSERIGSLVVNPGGPGAPGTDYAGEQADPSVGGDGAFREPIRDHFDIVGFDPRGTGDSTPVDCFTDEELDEYVAADPDPDTPAEEREFAEWNQRFGEGCVERSGDLAGHVSTYEAARDMDVIRAVLEEEKLTYFGASYGTKLGATYAGLFPERAGRLVLDGAVDIALPFLQSSLQQATGFQTALNAYVDDCVAKGDCYLGSSRQAALDTIREFVDSVDREPIPVGGRELQVGHAFLGIITPLYNRDYWTYLDQGLGQALDGDATFLLLLADLYVSRDPDGDGYTDNSAEAIYAINCLDDPSAIPLDEVPDHYAKFRKASPTFGRVFAWGLTGCDGLGVDAPEFDFTFDAAGADPMLVVGTTRDPATPYRWAQALARQLEPAILVSRDGDGHTGYNAGNSCVDQTIEDYLIEGVVPDGPVDCPAE
jgi:pimeloyl-ACP methyl ester carboxylesterase